MKHSVYATFRTTGLIGLAIQLALNLVVLLVFKRTAGFFSEQWFSTWFPGCSVWLIFLIIGIGGGLLAGKNGKDQQ